MENCPIENFEQLAAAVARIERFVGLDTSTDVSTLVGRIKTIRRYPAAQSVAKNAVVKLTDVGVIPADNTTADGIESIVGITLEAAAVGEHVQVQSFGLLQGIDQALDTSMVISLGPTGTISQGAPSGVALVPVGRAMNESDMFVDISAPIFLETN